MYNPNSFSNRFWNMIGGMFPTYHVGGHAYGGDNDSYPWWMPGEHGFYEIVNRPNYGEYIHGPPPSQHDRPSSASVDETNYPRPPPGPNKQLTITHADPCISLNGRLHHTKQYHLMLREHHPQLVIRRGQAFHMKFKLDRNFMPEYDGMSLIFLLSGETDPCIGKRTEVVVPIVTDKSVKPSDTCWSAQLLENKNNCLHIQVIASSTCIIGEWKLEVDAKLRNESDGSSYLYKNSIYIIFNPWCPHDQVYLDKKEKLQEYVLSDSTIVYRGSYNDIVGMPWFLGQYCPNILDLSIVLFSLIRKVCPLDRHDAVHITRALSAALNAHTDFRGVLIGRWTDNYEDGTPPTHWVGSVKILQQFYRTKDSVRYGQCWVFSGIMTTVCRAIGIPARSVTGFNCAHDHDGNLLLDKYFDESGNQVFPNCDKLHVPSDSSWNFHVWTEVWMKRPDLTSGDYDGWNVVDSTPQIKSSGFYQCGPASVKAIKNGDIVKPYDSHYVYAEVNADVVDWIYHKEGGRMKFINCDQTWVGRFISTKALGSRDREDLTHYYKFPEGSKEERSIMEKALTLCKDSISRLYLNKNITDLVYDCKLPHHKLIGSDLSIFFGIKNKGNKMYSVQISLKVSPADYNNLHYPPIKKMTKQCSLNSKSADSVKLDLTYDEYKNHYKPQGLYTVTCMIVISDQDYHYYHRDCFRLHLPNIRVEMAKTIYAGEPCKAKVTINNPLRVTSLTNGQLIFEGNEIAPGSVYDLKDLEPEKGVIHFFTWTPTIPGKGSLIVLFNCDQMSDARGQCDFVIKKRRN